MIQQTLQKPFIYFFIDPLKTFCMIAEKLIDCIQSHQRQYSP